MTAIEIGVLVEEFNEDLNPMQMWNADLYKCTICGRENISEFGKRPISTFGDKEYEKTKKLYLDFKRVVYKFIR